MASRPELNGGGDPGRLVSQLCACSPEALSSLPPDALQALTAAAARAYAAAVEQGLEADPVAPDAISATEAVVLCRGLLRAADIELFELSMWGAIQTDHEGSDDSGRR